MQELVAECQELSWRLVVLLQSAIVRSKATGWKTSAGNQLRCRPKSAQVPLGTSRFAVEVIQLLLWELHECQQL